MDGMDGTKIPINAEKHRIAVISDTHGLLRQECISILKTCEAVLHAGDVGNPKVLEQLEKLAKTYAVRGNVDKEWAQELPPEWNTELYGFQIYMVHNKKDIRPDLTDMDIVIYGHSHKYEERTEGKTIYLNPGSCGSRRFRLPVTMAVLTLFPDEHHIQIQKIDCLPELSESDLPDAFPQKDMDRLIRKVVKEIKANKGVPEIAAKLHADYALVEQICRIYTTHPGVDVDGILNRLELKNLTCRSIKKY